MMMMMRGCWSSGFCVLLRTSSSSSSSSFSSLFSSSSLLPFTSGLASTNSFGTKTNFSTTNIFQQRKTNIFQGTNSKKNEKIEMKNSFLQKRNLSTSKRVETIHVTSSDNSSSNPYRSLVIGIDGPAGSGKSTIAKMLTLRLGLSYVDSGAMYRAVAFLAHRQNCLNDQNELVKIAEKALFHFELGDDLVVRLSVNGVDVTEEIRSPLVALLSSQVALVQMVRTKLVEKQRKIKHSGLVMEGRDICTVVLPDADFKFFLTASLETRAKRRFLEHEKQGKGVPFEEIVSQIEKRDVRDENRPHSPLKPAPDSIIVDTEGLSSSEVVDHICQILDQRLATSTKK